MKTVTLLAILAFFSLSGVAQAKLVKCKKPDGQSVVQDVPCPPGPGDAAAPVKRPVVGEKDPTFSQKSQSSANWERTTPLPPIDERAGRAGHSPVSQPFASLPTSFFPSSQPKLALREAGKTGGSDYLTRKAEEERLEYNEQARARSKQHDCDFARKQASVVNLQKRIHKLDDKGERQFVDDQDRSRVIAEAERQASLFCQ